MKTTKEEILMVSLKLFAERGFDAVSTSMIANKLGITKGALYRHFENKKEIFDCIIKKMFELDEERASKNHVPVKEYEEDPESYKDSSLTDLCEFVNNQFVFWTEDEFASAFRKMIMLEQFKNPEMNKLYQDVLVLGPVNYSANMLSEMMDSGKLNDKAKELGAWNLAVQLFAPLQLMIKIADGGEDRDKLKNSLRSITKDFENRWTR